MDRALPRSRGQTEFPVHQRSQGWPHSCEVLRKLHLRANLRRERMETFRPFRAVERQRLAQTFSAHRGRVRLPKRMRQVALSKCALRPKGLSATAPGWKRRMDLESRRRATRA